MGLGNGASGNRLGINRGKGFFKGRLLLPDDTNADQGTAGTSSWRVESSSM